MFKETDSLARETVQNVLDNADGSGMPRVVEFEFLELPFQDFPDIVDFREVFLACQAAMRKIVKNGTANEEKFFQQGLDLLNAGSGTIPTLRIRDSGTTGLDGGDDEEDQPFCRLLRVQGVSSAQGVKGGTYGIGQRAPFHCSAMRTIIYYTRRKLDNGGAPHYEVNPVYSHRSHRNPAPSGERRDGGAFRTARTLTGGQAFATEI